MLNETQIADVWILFSEFLDKKQVDLAAERYVELLADYGVTDRILEGATGNDDILDRAIEFYLDDPDNADDDYEELE
jgi:hypothetical protein